LLAADICDELTAAVTSSQMSAASNTVQMAMSVVTNRIVISDAEVLNSNASDAVFQLLLLDVYGEPLLDVNGQYIIGG
jgi:hypothetical protein